MPTPKPNESKKEYIDRCIPIVINEGTAKDGQQAAAICNSMWKEKKFEKDDNIPMEIMSVGTWNDNRITLDTLKELETNFHKLKDQIKPPIKLGHSKDIGQPALGWVSDLKVIGDKLVAYVKDIPDLLRKAIDKKFYKRVSCEIFSGFRIGGLKNGENHGKVLKAVAILGADSPAVTNLKDLEAYFDDESQEFNIIEYELKIKPEKELDMSEDIKVFEDKINDLSSENQKLLDEKKALEEIIQKFETDQIELKKVNAVSDLEVFCNKAVEDGIMLPAQRDILLDKETLTFGKKSEIVITVDKMKKYTELTGKILEKEEKTESNDDNNIQTFSSVQEEMNHKVLKYMEEKKVDDYVQAFRAICERDPDLAKRYSGK